MSNRPSQVEKLLKRLSSALGSCSVSRIALVLGLTLTLGWAYWPTVQNMVHRWSSDPKYSHGFLVPVFAAVVLWARKSRYPDISFSINWWGLGLIFFGSVLRLFSALLFFDFLDAFSLLPTLLGVCLLLGGWQALHWAWPGILFLVFMMPAPHQIDTALAMPLQRMATVSGTYLLQTFGYPAIAEGNVIYLYEHELGVVEACSGLGMLITFFALSTAMALVIRRSLMERVIIFFSAIPIALLTNILRITVTGMLYVHAGGEVARAVFHDLAGWLMMPLALFLLWLELKFLSRLFSPSVTLEEQTGPIALGLNPLPSPGTRRQRENKRSYPPLKVTSPQQ